MTTAIPRRFELAATPSATAWIGEVLRRTFACSDHLPGTLEHVAERLNRVR